MTVDTKEYSKHLRLIHFSLVVACAAISWILLQPGPTSFRDAHDSLVKIQELNIEGVKGLDWPANQARREMDELRSRDPTYPTPFQGVFEWTRKENNKTYHYYSEGGISRRPLFKDVDDGFAADLIKINQEIKTLEDFIALWNYLSTPVHTYLITDLWPETLTIEGQVKTESLIRYDLNSRVRNSSLDNRTLEHFKSNLNTDLFNHG